MAKTDRRAAKGAPWLMLGGALSTLAALLHLGCIVFGSAWYRFFGAPESLIRRLEAGDTMLDWITLGIAAILLLWAGYAFSGAGLIKRLPLLRPALTIITAIYLARGLLIIPVMFMVRYSEAPFDYWSSLIVLGYGLVYAAGTALSWRALRPGGGQ